MKYFKEIESDGCSGGFSKVWKFLFKKPPPFEECCIWHDDDYMYGGGIFPTAKSNFTKRLKADNNFFKCLWKHSLLGKIFSIPMYIAVRLGGGSYWKRPYSWGFGWRDDND